MLLLMMSRAATKEGMRHSSRHLTVIVGFGGLIQSPVMIRQPIRTSYIRGVDEPEE
jgi:hypothetical protein